MPLSDSDSNPKGKLSAYQRWEMTSFEETKPKASPEHIVALKSEMDKLRIKAQKEGFNKGFEEGHQVGMNTGLNDMHQQLTQFLKISTQFNSSLQQAEQILAQDVLDLALNLAKAMLKNALDVNPELIIPIVEQAIASLPSVQQPAQLFLNPKDAAVVKGQIGAELAKTGWAIIADPHMNLGDCRVETLRNQINASMQTRWQQLSDSLGRDNRWYEPHAERKT